MQYRGFSCNLCYRRRTISITYSECVLLALCIQLAMCMSLIILSSVACLYLPYLLLYCHMWPVYIYRIYYYTVICGLSTSTVFIIILSSVACLHLPIFPRYFINDKIFEKKIIKRNKCVFWFSLQLLSETFIILRRNERDMIKTLQGYLCKYPLFLSDFNETWIFSTGVRKTLKYQIEICSVEPALVSRAQTWRI